MVSMYYGVHVLWCPCTMVSMATMVSMYYGVHVLWCPCTMVSMYYGVHVLWCPCTMVSMATMVSMYYGVHVLWCPCTMVSMYYGVHVNYKTKSLGCSAYTRKMCSLNYKQDCCDHIFMVKILHNLFLNYFLCTIMPSRHNNNVGIHQEQGQQ